MTKSKLVLRAALLAGLSLSVIGAAQSAGAQARNNKNNNNSAATVYRDTGSPSAVGGVGTESQDIVAMSDAMMRDLMTVPQLMNQPKPPRIIIDSTYFKNESSEIIDKALITDRIRVTLNRAATGKMMFIGRQNSAAVEEERALKRDGVVDQATTGLTKAPAGADYRLVGRIGTRDSVDARTGNKSRYSMYTFEMLDLESGELIWSNLYEFKKENRDDVVYR
jgi:hypothetical protein